MTGMLAVLAAALLSCLALPPLARRALRGLPPGWAVPAVTAAAVASALAIGGTLSVLAATFLVDWPPLLAIVHLRPRSRPAADVPGWVGLPAAALVLVLLTAAVSQAVRVARALGQAELLCRRLPTREIVLVDEPDVVTVAGWRGRILFGRALHEVLDPADRAVVTAHERSHLRRRHHLYVHAVDLAVAANPLLRGLRGWVRLGIERWADEDAATAVADRDLAARALARTALLRRRLRRNDLGPGPVGLAATGGDVAERVRALLAPAAVRSPVVLTAAALFVTGVLALDAAWLGWLHALAEGAHLSAGRH